MNKDNFPSLSFFSILSIALILIFLSIGSTNTSQAQTPTISPWEVPVSVCDPSNGPYSLTLDNPYLPFVVGTLQTLSDSTGTNQIQIRVTDRTELVAGVTTRVIERKEIVNGLVTKTTNNFVANNSTGTVCNFAKEITDSRGNPLPGSWRAGLNGAVPGVMMPADPFVGQTYYLEYSPDQSLFSRALHKRFESSFTTPSGTYGNPLLLLVDSLVSKPYAAGIGLIYEDGKSIATSSANNFVTPTVVTTSPYLTTTPTQNIQYSSPTATASVSNSASGDLNHDGRIDSLDQQVFITNFKASNCGNPADLNRDCKVDVYDYHILVSNTIPN